MNPQKRHATAYQPGCPGIRYACRLMGNPVIRFFTNQPGEPWQHIDSVGFSV